MLKSYKYRIYPTNQQKILIEQTFSACRLVYNLGLEIKTTAYKQHQIKISSFDLCYQLTEMKKDYKWLQEVDSQALQMSVKKIDIAFKNFFSGAGYPKFKSKRGSQSFQCVNNTRRIDFKKQTLSVPKIFNIPLKISREFSGKIKNITISRLISGKYFASILVDDGMRLPDKRIVDFKSTVGIDLGIKDFAILSNGIKFQNPKYLRNNLQRLKVLHRRISRKIKGGKNRKKAVIKIAIHHEKISNKRKDFLQKLSSKIVSDNQTTTFCVENLAVENMIKNHSLAQAISDVSWGEFIRMLHYKCEWSGKNIIEIGRFEPSTKTCSNCGEVNKAITLKDREWTCASCLAAHDRDVNAAINIKNIGLKTRQGMSGEPVEPPVITGVKKQEAVLLH